MYDLRPMTSDTRSLRFRGESISIWILENVFRFSFIILTIIILTLYVFFFFFLTFPYFFLAHESEDRDLLYN